MVQKLSYAKLYVVFFLDRMRELST